MFALGYCERKAGYIEGGGLGIGLIIAHIPFVVAFYSVGIEFSKWFWQNH